MGGGFGKDKEWDWDKGKTLDRRVLVLSRIIFVWLCTGFALSACCI
uniref:Uncharacterized protein n=1 Tax=Anguilla anguilla TaxID=7936 RepID=A0A0E9W577_ANGAN